MRKLRRHFSLVFLAVSAVSTLAAAQDAPRAGYVFMVYGVKTVAQCAAPLQALQTEVETIQFPDGWHFIVACNPLSWDFARKVAGSAPTELAFTDRRQHVTVLNAAAFRRPRNEYRHILVHELGHVSCACNQERMAENFAANCHSTQRASAPSLEAAPTGH